ncbi:MAG: protein-glutamate methylesterase/protein-glutamine glutaminase [Syntrophomonadaceae bacterium]|nr:chemotaxis response regulator protein-glutamate methylesterase [Syntrophomonadaceae bacterium]HAA09090.1 chemotaxis response regulator protein-glutamate methylesterase [Syntrophomonas sp.]
MKPIRVLVVDDSAFMRKVISDIINNDPNMTVIGTARDGRDALKKIQELNPDVVTMDVEMPGLDGLAALEELMKISPLPVLMISSLTKRGTEQTVKALQLGAVDFIAKPSGPISLDIDTVKEEIISKIKIAAGTKNKLANFKYKTVISPVRPVSTFKELAPGTTLDKLVLIGTSTGGPKALHEVIPRLPEQINAGILIVQHMPPGFTRSLAERLDSLSQITVKEAEHGEEIIPGCAYIAPGDYHLTVSRPPSGARELKVNLTKEQPRGGHRPAVDTMLESVAQLYWSDMICVIMTGMGNDGSQGVQLIKKRGGKVIAEHQSSCIVYGMPKAAIATGCVDKIVHLKDISSEVLRML